MPTLGWSISRLCTIAAASIIFICVLIFQLYGRSIAEAKGIPEAEAAHLLRVYLQSVGYNTKSPKFDIESNPGADHSVKGFYLYYDYGDTPQRCSPTEPGVRQIMEIEVELAMTSCGYAVPRDGVEERDTLRRYWQKRGDDAVAKYHQQHNLESIDGLPTGFSPTFLAAPSDHIGLPGLTGGRRRVI